MRLLALDLGSKTGWALIEDGEVLRYGTEAFWSDRAKRLAIFLEWCHSMKAYAATCSAVVYERPFCRGLAATRSLWGMAGVVEASFAPICAILDQEPQSIKAWAVRGGAMKEEMIAEAERRTNFSNLTEHEADAILLGLYTYEKIETVL